ncbi:MAG TPA: ASPIC/UnbV domain-containing protein, partial [Gemmataceae bacterium]|nr:ASPIC/UnbV domain-containing protein [Gemmataceae bacterium]
YLAQSSKTVHFGLGKRTRIDRVEIRWPSGLIQELPAPAINKLHEVVESGKETRHGTSTDGTGPPH